MSESPKDPSGREASPDLVGAGYACHYGAMLRMSPKQSIRPA